MSITLTPEQEEFIQAQLQTGQFSSAEEVVQAALQLLITLPPSPKKRFQITPANQGSGYANTAIDHDHILADFDPEASA